MTSANGLLAGDHHVHSRFSHDADSSIAANIMAADARGLQRLCLADHVRADTTWVDEFRAVVSDASVDTGDLTILCGVETKILDRSGRLDLPARLPLLDRILIADHQYPSIDGPVDPAEVRRRLRAGELSAEEVVSTIVTATARAMRAAPTPQLAHLFSLLPKLGLGEGAVGADQLALLATTADETGTVVEVNEKWKCPGPAAVEAFRARGVDVVASTDSHQARDVGVYTWVVSTWASPDPRRR